MEIWKLTGRHHWWLFSMGYSLKESVLEMHLGPMESEVWTQLRFGLLDLRSQETLFFFSFTLPPPSPTPWEFLSIWRRKKGEKGDCLSVATSATTALGWGQWQRRLPVWGLLFHCSEGCCTAHTVLFANENTEDRAPVSAKANGRDHPGLTNWLLCFIRLCLNVFPTFGCVAALPSIHWCERKTTSCFPWQTYKSRKRVKKSKGDLYLFLYCVVCVWC